jgi:hypothetical protein
MTKLEQVRQLAKRDATRCGRPLAILNLNPFNPLYVVREIPKATRPGELIEIVQPEA